MPDIKTFLLSPFDNSKEANFFGKRNIGEYAGFVVGTLGLVSTVLGFAKDNSTVKTAGFISTLLGFAGLLLATLTGITSETNLNTDKTKDTEGNADKSPAPDLKGNERNTFEANQALKVQNPLQGLIRIENNKLVIDKALVIERLKVISDEVANDKAKDLDLNPEELKATLPKIDTLDNVMRESYNTPDKIAGLLKLTPEQIIQSGINPKHLPEKIINEKFPNGLPPDNDSMFSPELMGGYIREIHKIGINFELFDKIPQEILEDKESNIIRKIELLLIETTAHETNHSIEAVLRSKLTNEENNDSVNKELKDEMVNGISSPLNFTGIGEYIPLPIPVKELREILANFTLDFIEQKKDLNYTELAKAIKNKTLLDDTSINNLKNALALEKKYPDILNYFNNEDDVVSILQAYMEFQILRHKSMFNTTEDGNIPLIIPNSALEYIPLNQLTLSERAKEFALQSAKEFMQTYNGNASINGSKSFLRIPSASSILSYTFANEEVRCNLVAIDKLISFSNTEESENLEKRATLYKLGHELLEVRKKISLAPVKLEKVSLFHIRDLTSIRTRALDLEITKVIDKIHTMIKDKGNAENYQYLNNLIENYHKQNKSVEKEYEQLASGKNIMGTLGLETSIQLRDSTLGYIYEEIKQSHEALHTDADNIQDLYQRKIELFTSLEEKVKDLNIDLSKQQQFGDFLIDNKENRKLVNQHNEILGKIKDLCDLSPITDSLTRIQPITLSA